MTIENQETIDNQETKKEDIKTIMGILGFDNPTIKIFCSRCKNTIDIFDNTSRFFIFRFENDVLALCTDCSQDFVNRLKPLIDLMKQQNSDLVLELKDLKSGLPYVTNKDSLIELEKDTIIHIDSEYEQRIKFLKEKGIMKDD